MKNNFAIRMASTLIFLAILAMSACSVQTPTATQEPATPVTEPTEVRIPTNTAVPQPEPIVLVDHLDREISLEGPAERIISLSPGATETLFAVGAGDKLVGRDTFSDYPEEALEIADIGGGFGELDIETIVSLDPDLVLASELTPPEQIQSLEDLGISVFMLSNPVELESVLVRLEVVGQLTGNTENADQLIASLQERIDNIVEMTAGVEEKPLVFYEIDGTDPNAVWTSGPGSFVGNLIEMAGGRNLGEDLDGPWVQLNIEELIKRDPDLILLGDYTWGGVTPDDVAARAGWEALSAVQEERVYPFDDNLVSRPGPRMVDGLEAMAELLHPELFE